MPYTYLIGWSSTNKFYYGVRFAKGCLTEDLWTTYFTSSTSVKKYRDKYGEPDVIQIRKTFDDVSRARQWETRVLKRMRVVNDDRFLNCTDNVAISDEAAARGRANRDNRKVGATIKHWYGKLTEDEKQVVRDAKRHGMRNKSEGARKSQSDGIKNYQLRAWSDPVLKEQRSATMRKPRTKVSCPHCDLIGAGGVMRRYHFDNCKGKPQ